MLSINGYHPLADDGGLYVAGIEHRLNGALFPHDTGFVTAQLHYSLFSSAMAFLVRATGVPLGYVLLLGYVASLWLTLYAGLKILRACCISETAQLAGVSLLCVWSSLPVAGTSLLVLDPYLTARSLSTPLSLLAISYALQDWRTSSLDRISRAAILCGISLMFAAAIHPLMAAYAVVVVILLRIMRGQRPWRGVVALTALSVLIAALTNAIPPPDSASARAVSLTRCYWFLSYWRWYELCGLAGPLCILLLVLRLAPARSTRTLRVLCMAGLAAGGIGFLVAALFAHASGATHLVARMQPLRIFLLIYAVMPLLLGAAAAERLIVFLRSWPRPAARIPAMLLMPTAVVLSAFTLWSVQRATYPASRHLELPWTAPTNPWSRAFLWSRDNTSRDALFALDADYISIPGEDAQTFRATALRSALPDFSKDGGEASIVPSLATDWRRGLTAEAAVQVGARLVTQQPLSRSNDRERNARLRRANVSWMILRANAATRNLCPYNNGTVKVCMLPPTQTEIATGQNSAPKGSEIDISQAFASQQLPPFHKSAR
jgi:hypothetical protein